MSPKPLAAPRQRSFDDQEIPLRDVTFCAVDLETTSGSWRDGEIVEIGAVKSRGGEILGTFETFVQPSIDLPVEIQLLTGITPSMLVDSLPLPAVLPAFIEFCGSAVFVAHNARFDKSFLDAACRKLDYPISDAPIVDTVRLARRILRNEVRSCGLARLSAHFRTPHTPCHRAFPDAAACLEVLWALIERGAAFGITTLADLLQIQSVRSNPHFEKVKLSRSLPTTRGVYSGSIGYLGLNGTMDTNIAIRTCVATGDTVYFSVGGGIVADSNPESEYLETLSKAAGMVQAIRDQGSRIRDQEVPRSADP